jgi:hypothetical protein
MIRIEKVKIRKLTEAQNPLVPQACIIDGGEHVM